MRQKAPSDTRRFYSIDHRMPNPMTLNGHHPLTAPQTVGYPAGPYEEYREYLDLVRPPTFYALIKRLMDILLVLLALPMVLPLMALTALMIRLDSPGPAFFCQRRVGKNGAPFMMLKFRSMKVGADQTGAQFTGSEDDRITRVGRFIRRCRLDEIPQLWNVLIGDMSLIGPRPEQVPFVEKFTEEISLYPYRHQVKPGLTGWAQVNQGYAAGVEETRVKLAYDLYYIKHCSLWMDFWIFLKTFGTVLSGYGAK